ncbi:Transposase, Mutator family [Streptomyces sp. Ncost-T10-10d]|nr:Transposase, Mutator family [Streptomyces sp. Ncost-T10-10d]
MTDFPIAIQNGRVLISLSEAEEIPVNAASVRARWEDLPHEARALVDIRYVPGSVEAVTPFVHEVVAAAEAEARPVTWRDLAGLRAARSARSALNEVFPGTRHQRCWVHKTASVLDALPKSAQPVAKRAIQEIYNAEDKEHAARAVRAFERACQAKYPKVTKRTTDDEDELLAFFDFLAEHWVHLRSTNPIESAFATVRLRTKVTKSTGSRGTALAMVFKLIESAQSRWRTVNTPHIVALLRAGARLERGHPVERPEEAAV